VVIQQYWAQLFESLVNANPGLIVNQGLFLWLKRVFKATFTWLFESYESQTLGQRGFTGILNDWL